MTLEELETKRDALLSSIASATKRLQNGDQTIEYQDVQQMERALRTLDAEIAKKSGTAAGSFGVVYGREGL